MRGKEFGSNLALCAFSLIRERRTLATATAKFNIVSMPIALPLKKMSRDEKLRAMEALWADLSQEEARFESPAWHDNALREAERAVKTGKARFSDWDEAKKRIRRKAAKLA
jgi:broad specificity phosphatase PhoE